MAITVAVLKDINLPTRIPERRYKNSSKTIAYPRAQNEIVATVRSREVWNINQRLNKKICTHQFLLLPATEYF